MSKHVDIYEVRAEIMAGYLSDIADLKDLIKTIEIITDTKGARAGRSLIRDTIRTNRDKMQLY